MTISKGAPYGEPAELPPGSIVAVDDHDLARLLAEASDPGTCFGLASGDLRSSLGGGARGEVTPHAFPVDLGWCRLDDGTEHPFVAHAVARTRSWSGPFVVAMNATRLGEWNLGPRAHPNDGLLDITHGALRLRQRLLARRRVAAGTHLPHPDLSTMRTATATVDCGHRVTVRVDGVAIGRTRSITLRVQPDAGCIVI